MLMVGYNGFMKLRAQAGFTMLELVITATIAAIIILVVIEGFNDIEKLNRNARNTTIATEVAQQELEKIRNTPYANIATGTSDITTVLSPYPSLESPRSAQLKVTEVDPDGLKTIEVDISYTIFHRTKKVQLVTQVANSGLNR